jgi:hypothetical protein
VAAGTDGARPVRRRVVDRRGARWAGRYARLRRRLREAKSALDRAIRLGPELVEAVLGLAALQAIDGQRGAIKQMEAASAAAREKRAVTHLATYARSVRTTAPRRPATRAAESWLAKPPVQSPDDRVGTSSVAAGSRSVPNAIWAGTSSCRTARLRGREMRRLSPARRRSHRLTRSPPAYRRPSCPTWT